MDIHNNTDNNPPRHAVESDDEDEFNPIQPSQDIPQLEIKLLGDVPVQHNLVVATGDPGAFWARGADLGEQTGAVAVNGVQVGLVFNPPWTAANVIVSEALSRLPVWAMHPYAQTIIDTLKPTGVALLDEYAVPSYTSSSPVSVNDAPIRYLSTTTFKSGGQAQPFAPPNLVNTTSASFLSILSIASNIIGTLLLLPSPNIIKPAPQTIQPGNIAHLTQDVTEWPASLVNQAQQLVFRAVNEPIDHQWQLKDDSLPTSAGSTSASRRSQVGEGGMYI